ncbi:MAG: glycosyltransferase, partial [Patescibacteria group bacterium]|nr:glycosyltransferase [Patescibacteria group bacterium]
DPASLRANLFAMPIAEPLAVVHRRAWAENAAGFNELLWREEHWEFWKRLARAGAQFAFLPLCSGRRGGTVHARPPHLTRRQRETFEANWRAGRPIYGDTTAGVARKPVQKVAFLSPYCLLDHTSGAAIATRSALQLLANSSFQARAFCGSWLDAPPRASSEYASSPAASDWSGNVETAVFPIGTGRIAVADPPQVTAFYQACSAFLDSYRPDAILTYGGDPVSQTLVSLARNRDIPVVFGLHNASYQDPQAFTDVDYVVVPSEYARQTWWDNFGMACHLLPNVIDPQRVLAADRKPECVTFVNPQTAKGGFVFARIAEQLARRRPDIPLLVVQGRSQDGALEQTRVDLSGANLQVIDSTADPRTFYARTKLLLMPSLCNESFGLTAAEAMLNGIPVLASNRGALPATVSDGGFLFDIPACYTPQTRDVPTADEVEPWIDAILRLWDTPDTYHTASTAAMHRAQAWLPDRLASTYQAFFSNLHPQPGPPYVPPPPNSP